MDPRAKLTEVGRALNRHKAINWRIQALDGAPDEKTIAQSFDIRLFLIVVEVD